MGTASSSEARHYQPSEKEVDISHFEIGIAIGSGAFGKVRTCTHKMSKTKYAIKYMSKAEVIRRGCTRHVLNERKLLEEAKHPFIVNLRYAFKDDENLVFVLDLRLGGDLRFHLNYKGAFPEYRARFYFAEIACALEYLHSLNIAHRDVKPENILLDGDGHATLTDFNVARYYSDDKPMNSRTGTARYMAPEVVKKEEYLEEVDWWSLAVTTYEMMYRHAPFRSHDKDELHQQILNDSVYFPNGAVAVSDAAKVLLSGMLVKDRTQRLGPRVNGGTERLKGQLWLQGINWVDVVNKRIPVPFVPDVS
ncbi:kinase-like protein [Rhizoclosmatium globosum]|uniref:non-specific serine/threonine protein kinase n=1 Tax=Rhizoclosmatium globosum TaxID=329046 RepID=A0A1Y2D4R2_9FUNG|nr:kinase-like protein [Rhizoclosmatium globosum]|eukprot:ORY53575.1 kinase-like protein [Rhizoclosmatium globosum]